MIERGAEFGELLSPWEIISRYVEATQISGDGGPEMR